MNRRYKAKGEDDCGLLSQTQNFKKQFLTPSRMFINCLLTFKATKDRNIQVCTLLIDSFVTIWLAFKTLERRNF